MTILVCVGSSCHLNGSHDIVNLMKKAIQDNHLEDKVTLKATFCLSHCSCCGVNARFDDEIVTGINNSNFNEVFRKHVLDHIK